MWVEFYPIISLNLAGEGDIVNSNKLSDLPEVVYGKYVGGLAGYQPWWVYTTISKSFLREVNK